MSLQNITPLQGALHILKNHFEKNVEFTKYVKEVLVIMNSGVAKGLRAAKMRADFGQILDAYDNWVDKKNQPPKPKAKETKKTEKSMKRVATTSQKPKKQRKPKNLQSKRSAYSLRSAESTPQYNLRRK